MTDAQIIKLVEILSDAKSAEDCRIDAAVLLVRANEKLAEATIVNLLTIEPGELFDFKSELLDVLLGEWASQGKVMEAKSLFEEIPPDLRNYAEGAWKNLTRLERMSAQASQARPIQTAATDAGAVQYYNRACNWTKKSLAMSGALRIYRQLSPTDISLACSPGPWGLTRTQSAVSYFSTFLLGLAAFKLATPPLRFGDDRERSNLGVSAAISAMAQF